MNDIADYEHVNKQYFHKRCCTCGAYGYKSKDDYKRKRKYCFKLNRYIDTPDLVVCPKWESCD